MQLASVQSKPIFARTGARVAVRAQCGQGAADGAGGAADAGADAEEPGRRARTRAGAGHAPQVRVPLVFPCFMWCSQPPVGLPVHWSCRRRASCVLLVQAQARRQVEGCEGEWYRESQPLRPGMQRLPLPTANRPYCIQRPATSRHVHELLTDGAILWCKCTCLGPLTAAL